MDSEVYDYDQTNLLKEPSSSKRSFLMTGADCSRRLNVDQPAQPITQNSLGISPRSAFSTFMFHIPIVQRYSIAGPSHPKLYYSEHKQPCACDHCKRDSFAFGQTTTLFERR
jgi:hypothetical protein